MATNPGPKPAYFSKSGVEGRFRTPPKHKAACVLGERLVDLGRYDQAERLFRSIVASDPNHFGGRFGLGRICERQERWLEAKDHFSWAVELRPSSFDALFSLGRTLRSLGRSRQGEKILRRAASLEPWNYRAPLELGLLYKEWRKPLEAGASFSRAIRLNSAAHEPYLQRMTVSLRQGRFASAFADAERYLDLGLATENRILRLTYPFGEHIRPPWDPDILKSIQRKLCRFIRREPRNIWARFYLLGLQTLLEERLWDEDVVDAVSRLARGRYLWMRWFSGNSLLRMGDFHRAINDLRPLIREYPQLTQAGCLLGEAWLGLGRAKEAMSALDRVKPRAAGQLASWLTWKGELYLWMADYGGALEILEKAGDFELAFCWRGLAKLKLGRVEEALVDLDEAVRRFPKDAEARTARGEAYRLCARYEEAARDLALAVALSAVSLSPVNPLAAVNQALIKSEQGDNAGMRLVFESIRESRCPFVEFLGNRNSDWRTKRHLSPKKIQMLLAQALKQAAGNRRSDYSLLIAARLNRS